jgi:hypothetical protein
VLSEDRLGRLTPCQGNKSDYQYWLGFDRTLGLGPIPRSKTSPAIAETTIAIRRTLRMFFTSLGLVS